MTQEEKQLLLIDLCARLPYMGFMVQWHGEDYNIIAIGFGRVIVLKPFMSMTSGSPLIEEVKPYLRPMSSMTEEEKVQLIQYACIGEDMNGEFIDEVQRKDCAAYIDWLNENHFDYRGLIEKGLAIEVTEENNPYKN